MMTTKETTVISNLMFRFNQLITRWLYRNHRRYKNTDGQDD